MTKKALIGLDDIERICNGLKLELLSRDISSDLVLKIGLTIDTVSKVYKKWFDDQPDVHGIEKQIAYFLIGFIEAYAHSDKSDVNEARNSLIEIARLLGLTKDEIIAVMRRYYRSWDLSAADWSNFDDEGRVLH